jgi:hypothetical protein
MKNISCACPNAKSITSNPYPDFDKHVGNEIKSSINADGIINKSSFCINVPLGFLGNDEDDVVTVDDIFNRLKGKNGIYHLWVLENDYCEKHELFSMRCLYVGKGFALNRAKKHIKEKWPDVGQFYISFYECSNRISKYLEQLFLDIYSFDMNESENPGTLELFGYWNRERYEVGTETGQIAQRFSEKYIKSQKNKNDIS